MRLPKPLPPEHALRRRIAEMTVRQSHECLGKILVMLAGRIEIDVREEIVHRAHPRRAHVADARNLYRGRMILHGL